MCRLRRWPNALTRETHLKGMIKCSVECRLVRLSGALQFNHLQLLLPRTPYLKCCIFKPNAVWRLVLKVLLRLLNGDEAHADADLDFLRPVRKLDEAREDGVDGMGGSIWVKSDVGSGAPEGKGLGEARVKVACKGGRGVGPDDEVLTFGIVAGDRS